MYAYIKGRVTEVEAENVVIEAAGVGWQIAATAAVRRAVTPGEEAKIFVFQSVREDGITLYGFISAEEKDMFMRLITVSGIGPKSAAGILSGIPAPDLAVAIARGDADCLTRAPGIGKKTAQRIILELKEKIDTAGLTQSQSPQAGPQASEEAVLALMALGYTRGDAAGAIARVQDKGTDAETLIRLALQGMGRV